MRLMTEYNACGAISDSDSMMSLVAGVSLEE